MSQTDTTKKLSAAGTGSQTAFPWNSPLDSEGGIKVIVKTDSTGVEVVKTITTHYTVAIDADGGGATITMLTAPTNLETLTLSINTPLTQSSTYGRHASIEGDFDKQTQIDLTLQEQLDRCFKMPITDGEEVGGTAFVTEVPAIEGAVAGDVLVVNSGKTAMEYSSVSSTGHVVGPASSTDNALARFHLATGKIVQNSGVIVDDSNNVSGVGTIATGALTVTGAIAVSTTVDGRDIATDGTKLDTIETSATADQTGAQIKTLYEAESSAFTDAQFTKLGAIEALADVTDEANVTDALDGATLTAVTVAGTDKVLVQDASDSDNLKTVTAQSIADLGGSGDGDLLADGTIPLTADWDVGAFKITGTQFESDIATGTAPFVVASTTEVANLNAATAGNATTVTTNANLTGHVTSTGNAAILGAFTKAQLNTAISDGIALNDVIDDTSPELGGNLNTGGFSLLDSLGNEIILFNETLSSVNSIEVINSTTGSNPKIGASGDDSNISLELYGSGTETVKITDTLQLKKGSDVASNTALPILSDGNFADVTGTTTITSFNTVAVGTEITLHFDGILLLTHHATNLVLPGAANITTAAGDIGIFYEYASGDWRCTSWQSSIGGGGGLSDVVDDTSPELGGDLDCGANTIIQGKGADVASAAALPLISDGNIFDVTGTTAITSMDSLGVGTVVVLRFDSSGLTLTHHATDLILPAGRNITALAGDVGTFVEYASGDWYCVSWQAGSPVPVRQLHVTANSKALVLTDANRYYIITDGTSVAVTIPANGTIAFPIGTEIHFQQGGAGAITVGITTDTLNVNSNLTKVTNGQHSVCTIKKTSATAWVIFGNLVAS